MNGSENSRELQLQYAALLAASGALRLTGEDVLRAIAYNSGAGVTITIAGRFQRSDGTISAFKFTMVPATDRTVSTAHFQLGEGWLLNVQAYASAGAPRRGQCYVGLELSRGTDGAREPIGTLAKDYIAEGQGIAWPGTGIRPSTDGPGCIRTIIGTNPAAGVEVSETVPTNARWRLLAINFQLATDATVANRAPALLIDDGVTTIVRVPPVAVQTASSSVRHTYAAVGAGVTTNGFITPLPPPEAMILLGGSRIQTATSNLQAADDYSSVGLHVEEWIED